LIYKNQYFVTKPDADFFNTIVHEERFPLPMPNGGYRFSKAVALLPAKRPCRLLGQVLRRPTVAEAEIRKDHSGV
jgi:hypothetical protein